MQHGIVFKKKDTDYLIKNNQVTEMDYSWWSVEDEIRSLTVWGTKLLCKLAVRQLVLLYILPEGNLKK